MLSKVQTQPTEEKSLLKENKCFYEAGKTLTKIKFKLKNVYLIKARIFSLSLLITFLNIFYFLKKHRITAAQKERLTTRWTFYISLGR